jgi:hypothetical protein
MNGWEDSIKINPTERDLRAGTGLNCLESAFVVVMVILQVL